MNKEKIKLSNSCRQSDTRKAVSIQSSISTQAIVCSKCSIATIAEYDAITNDITLYDFAPYINGINVKHRHTCDTWTRVRIVESVATEKRLLEDKDPNDYIYLKRGGDKNY